MAAFIDDAIGGEATGQLVRLALIYVAGAIAAEGLVLFVTWHAVRLSWRSGNRLRESLADHASRLDMAWHSRHSPGQLIERIDGDVEAMVVFFTNVLVHVVGNIALTLGMLVVAFTIDVRAGLVLALTAALGAATMIKLRSAAVPAREEERQANAILYGDLEERLGGLEDLRANGAGEYAIHRLHTNSARSWRLARLASFHGDGGHALAAGVLAIGSVGTVALGFWLQDRELITLGQVLALYRYSDMLRQPLELIAEQMKEFQKAVAGAKRARELLETESSVLPGTRDSLDCTGGVSVEFDAVTLGYGERSTPAVREVDFTIAAGDHVGIVGRTGSGKTTLGRLVARLWDVEDGSVRLNGVDVRDLSPTALRSTVSVVTQDVEVLTATIRDNITMWGSRTADDDAVIEALRLVGLTAWLDTQPDGLDTELHGGRGLSAGEAQLLVLARTFLADPAVIVLDEASSRLDPESDRRVQAALADLLEGRTALIIAHRLDTLDEVDRIVVMEDGRIVEDGRREELAADSTSRYGQFLRAASRAEERPS